MLVKKLEIYSTSTLNLYVVLVTTLTPLWFSNSSSFFKSIWLIVNTMTPTSKYSFPRYSVTKIAV
jgi:hypothetical protein